MNREKSSTKRFAAGQAGKASIFALLFLLLRLFRLCGKNPEMNYLALKGGVLHPRFPINAYAT
jgi:hypothetical protein